MSTGFIAGSTVLGALAACTAGTPPAARTPLGTVVVTQTHTVPAVPKVVPTGPVDVGVVIQTDGLCPYLTEATAVTNVGMRMARQSILSRAGKPIGCDFYADPAWAASEHLPGPNQPVLTISSSHYADSTSAYNAMVLISRAGTEAHQSDLPDGQVGISYRTRFDPADGAQDWAYVFARQNIVVTVLTAQTAAELNPRGVAAAVDTRF